MGDDVVQLQGWFREDKRLMYADVVAFVKLLGSTLTIHSDENDAAEVTMNVVGAEVTVSERTYKISITSSEKKVRLYAITKKEFQYWSETLKRVAGGDLSKQKDGITSFEKPAFAEKSSPGDIPYRRNASIDYASRNSSLDGAGRTYRAASLDSQPQEPNVEKKKGEETIMKRFTRGFRKS